MSFIIRITSFPEYYYWSLLLVMILAFILPFVLPIYRQRQVTLHFFWGQVPVTFKGIWAKLVVTLMLASMLYSLYEVTIDIIGLHQRDYYVCCTLTFACFFSLGLYIALRKKKTAKKFR